MNWFDYRKKLKIGFHNREKVGYVITDLITYAKVVFSSISVEHFISYMLDTGSPIKDNDLFLGDARFNDDRGDVLIDILIKHQNSLEDFLVYFMPLINRADKEIRDEHVQFVKKILGNAKIPYELIEDSDGYYLFPKGAKELDDALISQPLEWLKSYPKAHKTFCIALRQYSDGIYIRDVADNLRKALEEFLREFLENDCDLNKNKREVEAYLKSENADSQLIQMLGSLLTHYYLLNNGIAKHNDKTDARYLEFLLYQTGLFIRMLIMTKKSHQEVSTDAD